VVDAAGASAATWDVESGSFTYDANGNLLTAPAPYSLTGATYDDRNLPLTITRGGVTTTYRYDARGQRIAKQVGGGDTEVYVLDGATTLAVVTVTSAGTPTAWHFNILAGDRVIGRQPHTGARRHYHTDLLGSTRAVVDGATVVESTDADPWGLALPGRTLGAPQGSGTKEGFTGKERDLESGMDYFGARYYLPALGRWGSVDPAADSMPEWSSYVYVSNSPMATVDPDGRLPQAAVGATIGLAINLAIQADLSNLFWPCPNCRNELSSRYTDEEQRYQAALTPSDRLALAAAALAAVGGATLVMGGTSGMIVAARAAPIIGPGTIKIIDAIQKAGPGLDARASAVMRVLPQHNKAIQTTLEGGAKMLSGGTGEKARQVILNPDGSTVIKAFNVVTKTYDHVITIDPKVP